MTNRIDNQGRILHVETGIVIGARAQGADTYVTTILAQSAVPVALTGTTAETTLASITVPGGIMGPNGCIRVTALWSATSSANLKNYKAKFGATVYLNTPASTSSTAQTVTIIRNRGSQKSQVGSYNDQQNPFAVSATPPTTSAIDTSTDQVVSLTGTLATAGETITLESYMVEVLAGA